MGILYPKTANTKYFSETAHIRVYCPYPQAIFVVRFSHLAKYNVDPRDPFLSTGNIFNGIIFNFFCYVVRSYLSCRGLICHKTFIRSRDDRDYNNNNNNA
jgi:hypothetical protein